MKQINITGGEAFLKDFCTRKLKKEIDKALFGDIIFSQEDGKANMSNLTQEAMNKANDVALLGMISKIVLDGKEMPITIDTIDSLDTKDVDNLILEINKITSRAIPNA